MRTDISGAVKNILQVRANLKAESSNQETGKGVSVSFMELMSQSSLPNMNVSAGSGEPEFGLDTKSSSDAPYDTYFNPVKNVSFKEEITQEEAAGPIGSYEEEIRRILKEELGVSEEEISAAMEGLGITFLDLGNLKDLTSLVQKLTGEDVGMLFSSEAFQNVVEQVTAAAEELCAELGISKEELNALCELWMQTENAEAVEADVVTEEIPETPKDPAAVKPGEEAVTKTAAETLPKEEAAAAPKEESSMAKETPEQAKTAEDEKGVRQVMAADTEKKSDGGTGDQNLLDHFKDARPDAMHTGNVFTGQQAVSTEEFVLPQEAPQPYADQVDAFELIDQIARNVRVTVMETGASMEMQLNPEHLGKIYLNVSEREGVVRAQIATQTAVVKEALETQLVELRQSLNQQGIKVDAIEVTVSTHEFEQNLEENAKHEEQMRQQREESQKQTRRSLNLNDLDGLSGLMSEEEQLAAQIMKDNGNQVDFTA